VIATGNHILVQLKGNQPSLQACLVEHAHCHPPADRAYACDLGQCNRIEQRTAEVWPLTSGLGTEPWHDRFQALIRVHHVRDTRLDEDATRIRCNPGIFAKLRSFALSLLRFNGVENISLALYDNALSLDCVLAYRGL
jgi:hypothetical protein